MKRVFDFTIALIGLAILSPVFLVIAVVIKLSSSGPVFYRGIRTGRYGVPFRIFKFRSMVVNAEKMGGTTTGKNDSRLLPIGEFLRKYKLDELPQLINVLLGNMSFVGPRPEVSEYTDAYTDKEQIILSVLPGITDCSSLHFHDLQAEVGAENPDETFRRIVLPQKIALRMEYVTNRSFLSDLKILFQTVSLLLLKPLRRTP